MTSFGHMPYPIVHPQQIAGTSNAVWWSLVASMLSLLVAASSLLWNVYVYKLSGRPLSNVRLEWRVNSPSMEKENNQVDRMDSGPWGYDPHVTVRIINSGRAALSVSNMFFSGGGVATLNGAKEEISWPIVVRGGEEKVWHFGLRRILDDLQLGRADLDEIAFISQFGDGTYRKVNLSREDLYRLIGSVTWNVREAVDDPGQKL